MLYRERVDELVGRRVMITGGLGLIGSALARQLVDLRCDVLLVDSLNDNFGGNPFNIDPIRERVRVNISDIRDKNGLRYLLRDREYIFNLAGQTSHMDSMTAPFEDLQINCEAQLSIVETCRDVNPQARIIFASTRQIYGRPQFLPVDESHPLSPVDVNGINKIAGEHYHLLYHAVYGLKTSVLRLTNTFGPGMRIRDARQIFVGMWVRRLLEQQPFEVWGGHQRRDFTYVDDAAEAFIAAALTPETIGKALNVGGSEPMSILALAEILVRTNGGGSYQRRDFPNERQKIDIGDYWTDDAQFRHLTGWRPETDVETGIGLTLRFYRDHFERYT